ncbi:MAG: hypothetical protein R3C40_00185 [Parvularculaceae bacterium]
MTAVIEKIFSPDDIAAAKAWPFQEARALEKRLDRIKHDGVVVRAPAMARRVRPISARSARSRAQPWCAARLN